MNIIDAAEARRRVDDFWRGNNQRSLAEKVMNNIIGAAQAGRSFVYWHYALSKEVIDQLLSLGYRVENLVTAEKNKNYNFLIRWDN